MASVPPDPVPLLVSLKAVDPGEYPYYGTAELEPAMSLAQALEGDSAVVADEFLDPHERARRRDAAPGRTELSASQPCLPRSPTASRRELDWGRA